MDQPNIVLLILDAVRADHLSCYGHRRETTPNIDNFATNNVRYENAFSNSNWTGTSHGALFTGQLPSRSGVYGDNMELPADVTLLSERLQSAGYRTFATSAGLHIRSDRGYDRGFDTFLETYRVRPTRDFLETLLTDRSALKQLVYSGFQGHDNYALYKFERLQRWIQDSKGPFFAFVNCKTAHNPYNPPRPYKQQFCDPVHRPPFEFIERALEQVGKEPQHIEEMDIERLRELSRQYPILGDAFEPTNGELEALKQWYDGSIRYLDQRIGNFLDFLRAEGIRNNTHVIITADHGELFGEHGLEKHYYSLYEPVLHIPLLIDGGWEDVLATVTDPVSLLDLYPTILEWAGIDPPEQEHADSLTSVSPPNNRYLFSEVGSKSPDPIKNDYPSFDASDVDGPIQSVRNDEYKLIRRSDGQTELYRWREDPAEVNNLVNEQPEVIKYLENVLEKKLEPMSETALNEKPDDPELEQHLEDMGYL